MIANAREVSGDTHESVAQVWRVSSRNCKFLKPPHALRGQSRFLAIKHFFLLPGGLSLKSEEPVPSLCNVVDVLQEFQHAPL